MLQSDTEESFTDTEESDLDESTTSTTAKKPLVNSTSAPLATTQKSFLEPLNLVWAKIPGFPWLPGIIMNENTLKSDLKLLQIHADVPSTEILVAKRQSSHDYLVYLFERKKPWHYVASTKLKQFGIDDKRYVSVKKTSKYHKKLDVSYKKALNVYNLLNSQQTVTITETTVKQSVGRKASKQNEIKIEFNC